MNYVDRSCTLVFGMLMNLCGVVCGETPSDPFELPIYQSPNTLVGQVVAENGEPVAQADVYLLRNPDGAFILPVKPLKAKTSAEGTFGFNGLEAGGYRIWAETENATSLVAKLRGQRVEILADDSESAAASPPDAKNLQLVLHAGCGLDVLVLDTQGNPITGADISFGWTDIDRHYTTEDDGIARIRNLAIDDWYVVVRAEGMATDWFKTSKQNLGSILPLSFQLKPGASLRIKTVDETGAAVDGAKVYVGTADRSMAPYYTQAKTGPDGQVLATGLPLDRQVRIYVSKDGYESANSNVTVPVTLQDTEIQLKRKPYGGDVLITVVDSSGDPIAGAELVNRGNSSADVRRAQTDAEGRALLQDVQKSYAGVVVVAKAEGFVAQEAQATAGTIEQPGELHFELQRGNTLRGRITNPAGEPMPKLRVYYDRGENGDLKGGRVDTDDDGRFELKGLGPEVLFTVYTPPEYAPIQQLVLRTDLDELMELTLVPTGLLRVRAVDSETEKPLPAFNVRIAFCEDMQTGDLSPRSINSSLIEEGVNIQGDVHEYRLDNQVAGTAFKVIVSAAGYNPTTVARMVTVTASSAECVDVPLVKEDMRDFQVVAGRILDADGRPVAGAAVRLMNGRAVPGPQLALPGIPQQRMGGWQYYHWDLLKRDDIENRDQCEQFLRAVSDRDGKFRFEKVKRDTPFLELYYTGEGIFAQRYSNLRDRTEAELQELVFVADRPSELRILVDRTANPQAATINVAAEDWLTGINAIKLPYSYQYRDIAETNDFANLPAGTYTISLMSENRPTGDGGFTSRTLTSKSITLEPGKKIEISF